MIPTRTIDNELTEETHWKQLLRTKIPYANATSQS